VINKLAGFLLFTLLISAVLLTSACSSSSSKTYSLNHDKISFSLEYPGNYKIISSYIQSNTEALLSVRFARASGFLGLSSKEPIFCININSSAAKQINPAQAADTAGGHKPEQETERGTISIAGITGESVTYSYPNIGLTSTITREVFFNVNGVLWNIFIYSGTDKADEAKLVFNQVISSFKLPK
jgi:hypothetical protein